MMVWRKNSSKYEGAISEAIEELQIVDFKFESFQPWFSGKIIDMLAVLSDLPE